MSSYITRVASQLMYLFVSAFSAGDIVLGVATQCMKSSKCSRAKEQYYANVCLKYAASLSSFIHD